MLKMMILSTFVSLLSSQALGSYYDHCTVQAKVTEVNELSVLTEGSQGSFGGLNNDSSVLYPESYTYVNVVTVSVQKVIKAGGHSNCQHMLAGPHKFVSQNVDDLSKLYVGAEVKLSRTYYDSRILDGVSKEEKWEILP